MLMTETINFALGAALFVRSMFKALYTYVNKDKDLPNENVRGTGLDKQLPKSLPSIVDIKQVIPKHCFQPSLSLSVWYSFKDLVQVVLAYALLSYLDTVTTSGILRAVFIVLYWAIQGTFFMGVFVMGHDCGHGSFSNNSLINDIIGTISHGFLMVPYYQWKLSHKNHHKNTANVDKDEVFYPVRKSEQGATDNVLPGFALGFGWYIYLAIGYRPRQVNHFNPFESMFNGHVIGCICSLLSMSTFAYLSYLFYLAYGLEALAIYYIVPLLVFGGYVVVITFLHHSEVNIPWYADQSWDFVKGQLSSVDRDYGIIHHVIHCIGTHQMHHMFSKIPHYHLEEATHHFQQAFPHLVRKCDEPILPSFVRMFKKYVKQSTMKDEALEHVYQ